MRLPRRWWGAKQATASPTHAGKAYQAGFGLRRGLYCSGKNQQKKYRGRSSVYVCYRAARAANVPRPKKSCAPFGYKPLAGCRARHAGETSAVRPRSSYRRPAQAGAGGPRRLPAAVAYLRKGRLPLLERLFSRSCAEKPCVQNGPGRDCCCLTKKEAFR